VFHVYRNPLRAGFLSLCALGLIAASACAGGGGTSPATPSALSADSESVRVAGGVAPALTPAAKGTPVPKGPGRYLATVLADNPVVFYQLDERSGRTTVDSSGHHHNGSYVAGFALGKPPLLVTNPSADSASFPTGYAADDATWTQQAVTAECWIRPSAADVVASPRIIDNAWTDHDGNGFMLWIANGTIVFNTGWLQTTGTTPLVANKTYHVVGTYDSAGGASVYLNGLQLAIVRPGATPNPEVGDSATTYIGALNATAGGFGFTDYFQGDISDCAVYNHALTPERIAAHYNAGANATVTPRPVPTVTPTPSPPPPTPAPSPISYDAKTACIDGQVFANTVLPAGEGEFASNGLDRTWWSRRRGNDIGGNHYSGFQTSWGRNQYDTYFGDKDDGISSPSDDPFYVGQDTDAPGSPHGVRISAKPMPQHLIGNPQVNGASYYAGVLDTPVDEKYGFFVARVRVPGPAPGMSPAYWLLSNNGMPQGQHGPLNGEWDIQEMFGNDLGNGMNSGNLVWNSGASTPQNWGGTYTWPDSEHSDPSSNYHDYGALIGSGGAKISPNDYGPGGPGPIYGPAAKGVTNYLDGVPLYAHTGGADMTANVAWKEMMAMFQVGPKGGWLGSPNPSQFPAYYWIQWLRVYEPTKASCH